MSLLKNLSNAKLDETTRITFVYEQGTDVFHFNETHVETALEETDVVERLAHVITRQLPLQMPYVGDPLGQLRDHDLLNDYARDGDFETYVQEQLRDNFYDLEMIDESTERYDHKRGFTTLTTQVDALASDVLEHENKYSAAFSGWEAQVKVGRGTLTFTVQ
tara:strand:+ start:2895 stop:3380 length:486 start_codon:yes stop_codon:yes gene_type:complete